MNLESEQSHPHTEPADCGKITADALETVDLIYPVLRIEFKGNRRQYFSNPMDFSFHCGELAVVQVEKGEDIGRVVGWLKTLPGDLATPLFGVLRRATARDLALVEDLRLREKSARQVCQEMISKHGLVMKLVDVEFQFDGRKLTFYFTADGRVDFRQLVKDLAAAFRTRIELRQIGARDETRRFGGLGPCGRVLCCASFVGEFCPITTQMAKDQNLPLNPGKISGCCGRLKCCLGFEINCYRETLKTLPRWEAQLETTKGPALVEKLDVFNCTVTLRFPSGEVEKFDSDQLAKILLSGFSPEEPADLPVDEETLGASLLSDDEFDYPHNPS